VRGRGVGDVGDERIERGAFLGVIEARDRRAGDRFPERFGALFLVRRIDLATAAGSSHAPLR